MRPAEVSWRPLLSGASAAPAWRTIEEIAETMTAWPNDLEPNPDLASGAAGLALFYAYLAQATGEERYADVALGYVERMVDWMSDRPPVASLYSGFCGVAWTLEHLSGRLLAPDAALAATAEEIDEALLALLRHGTWSGDYDLINGLAGFGVYALEVLPRGAGQACLEALLDQLDRLAEAQPVGLSWYTPPECLVAYQRRQFPAGYHNLGLAHGVPAVIALLGAASGAGSARARRLLAPAVRWLLAQELPADAATRFPHTLAAGIEPGISRLAWCYGDPGVAVALLQAGRIAGESGWERAAKRLALDAAARPETLSGVVDACLCHGAAGLAHVFNRMAQSTGDWTLEQAARWWIEKTLAMRRHGEGVGGYLTLTSDRDQNQVWRGERGFLVGSAGIALALLAAVSPVEPAWDRVLMTSLRPVGDRDRPAARGRGPTGRSSSQRYAMRGQP